MDIDVTYLIQLGIFLFLLVSLNQIILKPFLRVIRERDAKIEGARGEVEGLRAAGDADQAAYQDRMRTARHDAHESREALKGEGREEQRKILTETREEIAKVVGAARDEIEAAELRARMHLSSDTEELAESLVEKMVRGGVQT